MNLESLKQEVKLIDYIEGNGGVELKKAGSVYHVNPCPKCGHNDHFTIYPTTNSYSSFNDCCNGGSILDFFMELEGLEFSSAIDKLKEIAGEPGEPKREKEKIPSVNIDREIDEIVKKDASSIIGKSIKTGCDYYHSRGLSEKTIKKYNLGYLPEGGKYGPAFKYVMPVTENFIIFRSDNEKDRYRNYGNTEILNLRYLQDSSLTGREIYVTEGYFDALSLEEMDLPAVALNSSSMADQFVLEVEKNKTILQDKLFIIALDNDQAGRQTTEKLIKALEPLEVPCTVLSIDYYKDINEYYINDKEGLKADIDNLPFHDTNYEYLSGGAFEYEQIQRHLEPEILTGINALDKCLGGGLYPGLYALGSISSLGKTALVLQIADRIAEQQHPVLFFSLEMAKYEMTCRSLARVLFEQTGNQDIITGHILRSSYRGRDITINEDYKAAINNYKEGPARYMTMLEGNYNITVSSIKQQIKKYIHRTNRTPVVVIDYLQVIRPVDVKMSDKQAVDHNVIELKRISRELNTPVIVVSSFNRANYKTQVSFESFKESGSIEFTSDVVMGLQFRGVNEKSNIDELKNKDPRQLEINILKNRRGKAYEKIDIDYFPKQNFFIEA